MSAELGCDGGIRRERREWAVSVDTTVAMRDLAEQFATHWRIAGGLMVGMYLRIDRRLEHIETDVAVLKTDVAELKGQVGRIEESFSRFSDRIDSKFEQIMPYILRNEAGPDARG